jgi:hypothetical protein
MRRAVTVLALLGALAWAPIAEAQSISCYHSASGRWTDCDNGQSFYHSRSGRWSDDNYGNTYWHSRRETTDQRGNVWEHDRRGRTYGPDGTVCERRGRWTDCQ